MPLLKILDSNLYVSTSQFCAQGRNARVVIPDWSVKFSYQYATPADIEAGSYLICLSFARLFEQFVVIRST